MIPTEQILKIPLLLIQFKNPLDMNEISFFRGAILSKVPTDLTLFHNHTPNGFRYRYPLIQYKRIGGKAAILCLGEGTEVIGNFFIGADFDLQIGNRNENLEVEKVSPQRYIIQIWEESFCYTCRKWLPLNQKNFARYQQLGSVAERAEFLQKILIGNILSMCTGLGIHQEKELICKITSLKEMHLYKYKGVKMAGFDIEFMSNISLPDYIGLGKGVSIGFGITHKLDKYQNKQ